MELVYFVKHRQNITAVSAERFLRSEVVKKLLRNKSSTCRIGLTMKGFGLDS